MANMGYCRFENTLTDLRDCYEHMGETSELSKSEERARERILHLAVDIIEDYGEEIDKTVGYPEDY